MRSGVKRSQDAQSGFKYEIQLAGSFLACRLCDLLDSNLYGGRQMQNLQGDRICVMDADDQLYKPLGFCGENPSWVELPLLPRSFEPRVTRPH